MLRFSRILFGTYNPFRLCTTAFAAGTAAFAARVASCPFVLAEVKEPNSPLLTITSNSSTSDIFSRCVQWQLDANLSLVHQLLREFDASVCRLMELLASQTQFLRCYTPESDPELDEVMIKNRSDWILTLKRLDKLELAIESGISLLRTSVETTFMCEDLINGNLNTEPSHAPGQRLSRQGSEMLQSVESEYRRLKGLRTITTNRWSVLISEHIANWGQLAKQ
ncbi:unnamed protein product [Dicrocoelium dendriticum]|nr:unnamed protein product [Dicrocoelium dendriticum]